ncbi:MAG: hypothetical protein JNK11_01015 [Alphaproteobacteria bacterium]|nr:hypothetical protein [Alphaproteobacteria bacterium]
MSLPTPVPGLLIRYAYLWRREADAGREEASKDRPCAVVLATPVEPGAFRTVVLPVTHAQPADSAGAVEIPAGTKRRLGMDAGRSWILLSEANIFLWPGPDLRPLPGQGGDSVVIGMLPARLFLHVRDCFVARWRSRTSTLVARTE